MKKIISLIKVSLNHDMNIFRINTKKQNKVNKYLFPLLITVYLMVFLGMYSYEIMKLLRPLHLEFVCLSLFGLLVSIITLLEGIYKSSTLLFNCKDDDMLLSLPIKKNTVLFIRMFKFYIFELLYNSLFLLPTMIIYAIKVSPSWTFYLSSFFALLLLPIVPIIISCIIGFITTYLSSKFKGKNIVQTIISFIFILAVFYLSYNLDGYINNIAKKASSINDFITRLYYPVGSYISLVTDFKISTLLIYILVHVVLSIISIFILGKIYFRINSNVKKVLNVHKSNGLYKITTRSKAKSFIKKEFNKFISTPVFITNAGFSLILFLIFSIAGSIRYDSIVNSLIENGANISKNSIATFLPLIVFTVICFLSFMTSITSSMISFEGKTFNLLKSLPLKPINIVIYKVLSALIIIIPCLIIGDIIIIIRFKFNIISIILILLASIIFPFFTELIGIISNLKYPKMDATNDTEVVKQSMSTMVSAFIGFGLVFINILIGTFLISKNINPTIIMLIFISLYGILSLILWTILKKNCNKLFNNINT